MNKCYLRKWQDPILGEPCKPVEDFSELNSLINSMYSVIRKHSGCGIAAPQAGYSQQVLIAKIDGNSEVFVNPLIEKGRGYVPFLEGCLSFPEVVVPTIRRFSIDLKYQTKEGMTKNGTYRGINAIILQHEIDHLNGKQMFNYFK